MKNFIFKSLILGVSIAFLLFGTVFASMEVKGTDKKVDGIKVNLSFMTNDVKTGDNDLMVKLYDSMGKPIGGAKVKVTADMDRAKDDMGSQMGNSGPLQAEPKSSHEVGQYMSNINFTDSGIWMVKVTFNVDGKDRVADFQLNVVKSGPNWYVIGGFLGIVATIMAFALVNKKRKSSEN